MSMMNKTKKQQKMAVLYIGVIVLLIAIKFFKSTTGIALPFWVEASLTVILIGFAFSQVVMKRRKSSKLSGYAKAEPYLVGLLALIVIGITFAEQF